MSARTDAAIPSRGRMTTPAMPHMCLAPLPLCRRDHWRARQFQEIAENAKPDLAALFRMKLGAVDIAGAQGGRDAAAVIVAIGQPIARVGRLRREGMDEIAGRARRDAVQNGAVP